MHVQNRTHMIESHLRKVFVKFIVAVCVCYSIKITLLRVELSDVEL